MPPGSRVWVPHRSARLLHLASFSRIHRSAQQCSTPATAWSALPHTWNPRNGVASHCASHELHQLNCETIVTSLRAWPVGSLYRMKEDGAHGWRAGGGELAGHRVVVAVAAVHLAADVLLARIRASRPVARGRVAAPGHNGRRRNEERGHRTGWSPRCHGVPVPDSSSSSVTPEGIPVSARSRGDHRD